MLKRRVVSGILCLVVGLMLLVGCKPQENDFSEVSTQLATKSESGDDQKISQPTTESNSETSTSEEVWTPFV